MRFLDALKMSYEVVHNTWIAPRPYIVYIKPTARCDCRCRICKRWQAPSDKSEEMSTEQFFDVMKLFRGFGASVLVAWGGEPLLRSDIADLFREAKRLGYRTSMCTNGRQLAKKADEVMPWLDTVLCSLDGYGPNHDAARGVDGVFERMLEGIRAAKRFEGKRIKIWASLHNDNYGDIEPIAKLAQELGVWVDFFPVATVEGHNDAMILDREGRARAFEKVIELKRAGYPIWNFDAVLRKMRDSAPFRCNFGQLALQVDHRGYVASCENPDGSPLYPWGRYDEIDWRGLFASERFRAARADLAQCGKCRMPCVMEMSDSLVASYASQFARSLVKGA
jgi:MoaA/NifB/PqqE/SkfB family radical SAM enzyme